MLGLCMLCGYNQAASLSLAEIPEPCLNKFPAPPVLLISVYATISYLNFLMHEPKSDTFPSNRCGEEI